ncbi:MAG: alpha/beta fold hydrolase [Anaerolineae bacterium]|nr:alpha/beta fold hydrolase [Anaerolineae bacterium]
MTNKYTLRNPHLPGDTFYWEGGSTGILLIHGFTATTAEVRLLAERLHAKGYTVSGPLLPGHGTTPADANRFSWQDWIATAEAAYQEISARCERVYVGGESTGGVLALYLASQHPEIRGVLAYAPAMDLGLSRWEILALRLAAPFIPALDKHLAEDNLPWQGYTETPLKALLQLIALQRWAWPLLPAVQQPLLIIQGAHDGRIPSDVPERIAEKVSAAHVEIYFMEQSGHVVILDREIDQVAALTLEFLARGD